MHNSSSGVRVLPTLKPPSRNHHLSLRLRDRQNHLHSSNLVLTSIQNLKRISELDRELAISSQLKREEMETFMEENKVCQVELLSLMKAGQFSNVYRVRIKASGKHFALKKQVIDPQHESREQELCRRLKSNFVVRVADIYHSTSGEKQELNILMELYDWNLKDFLRSEERMEYLIFKVICYQMARALFYVHSKGVTHRDIKPENFLMKKSGRVVLCDFGSAKIIKKGDESLAYLNSRSYRAPELLLGSSSYSNAVDIWALGCVILQLITRKEYFKGTSTIDCLLNICRVQGTRDLKRMKENEQLIKLLPNIKGLTLAECLHDISCPLLIDLLDKMLRIKSEERLRAVQVLAHPFFDELRQEPTYNDIMREKMDISDFFAFTPGELRNCEEFRTKLIPVWKRDRLEKHI